jgi:hypothetical protein
MKCPQEIPILYPTFMLIYYMLDKKEADNKLSDLRKFKTNRLQRLESEN